MGFIKDLKAYANVIKERDPAIKSDFEVLLYPSFNALRAYKKAHTSIYAIKRI